MQNLAWAPASKIRIISRKDAKAAKKQNKFPNLAFLAPWREKYPSPIKKCASHANSNQGDNARLPTKKPEDPIILPIVKTHYCLETLAFDFLLSDELFLTPELNARSS